MCFAHLIVSNVAEHCEMWLWAKEFCTFLICHVNACPGTHQITSLVHAPILMLLPKLPIFNVQRLQLFNRCTKCVLKQYLAPLLVN